MGLKKVVYSLNRHPLNFRSISDMNADIVGGLVRLQQPVDLVVGIPRSGMLAASMLALHLNCALTDVDGLLNNRLFSRGKSREGLYDALASPSQAQCVLILDDSVYSGREMNLAKRQLAHLGNDKALLFAAVYVSPQSAALVDFYFAVCPNPRVFEWNLMHHNILQNTCLDIDGVLCRDPTEIENDDGPLYKEFIRTAQRLLLPTVPVGYLVTSRLEKYRDETEAWLARHNVKYKNLIMMNLPTKEARMRAGNHGEFKAQACKDVGADFFIESDKRQAVVIAENACVDVFCVQTRELVTPSFRAEIVSSVTSKPRRIYAALRRVISAIK
jgi:orotate phosphoribosyltransferase